MLVLCQSGFVSQFSDRYVIEELGIREPYVLKKVHTCSQFCQELADPAYMFCVLEIAVLLQQISAAQIKNLFDELQGKHVTVLGSAIEFAALPVSAADSISTYFNTGATMNAGSPLYIDSAPPRQHSERDELCRNMLMQISRGRQYGTVELQKLGTHLGLWTTDSCIFVLCLDLIGTREDILDLVTPDLLEQCIPDTLSETHCTYLFPKSHTAYWCVISFHAKGIARQNNYMNTFGSSFYTAMQRTFPFPISAAVGISSLQYSQAELSVQFEEASNAAFRRVYDGTNRIYHTRSQKSVPAQTFDKKTYMKQLQDAIEKRSETEIHSCLATLFERMNALKLPERQLQGILMEIMSMMYMLCVEENLNIADFNDNTQDSIDFLFLQNILSIKQEHKSFAEHFSRILHSSASSKDRFFAYGSKTRRVIQHILKYYQSNIQLKDLSEIVGVSPNYLCSVFKKDTGFTVIEYLNAVRIEQAKELLRTTDLSATEVAQQTGFSDTAYFCSVFKRITNRTVTDYRNQPDLI